MQLGPGLSFICFSHTTYLIIRKFDEFCRVRESTSTRDPYPTQFSPLQVNVAGNPAMKRINLYLEVIKIWSLILLYVVATSTVPRYLKDKCHKKKIFSSVYTSFKCIFFKKLNCQVYKL